MNGIGYRTSNIGSRTQGGFSMVATAAALAFAVNAVFGVVLFTGTTAGQRSYRNADQQGVLVANASGPQRKACERS